MTKACKFCGGSFEKRSCETKKYFAVKQFCSSKCYGAAGFSAAHKNALSLALAGHKRTWSDERRVAFLERMSGERSPRWKGGEVNLFCLQCGEEFCVRLHRKDEAKFCSRLCATDYRNHGRTNANERVRKSAAYKAWRTHVFKRDNYTCQLCGVRNHKGLGRTVEIHADHIKPFALYPELRLNVDNGRTLCGACHRNTNTYGRIGLFRMANFSVSQF